LFLENFNKTKIYHCGCAKAAITQEISASGKVCPPQTLNLYFKTGGKLVELKVKTGDNVDAGQIWQTRHCSAGKTT